MLYVFVCGVILLILRLAKWPSGRSLVPLIAGLRPTHNVLFVLWLSRKIHFDPPRAPTWPIRKSCLFIFVCVCVCAFFRGRMSYRDWIFSNGSIINLDAKVNGERCVCSFFLCVCLVFCAFCWSVFFDLDRFFADPVNWTPINWARWDNQTFTYAFLNKHAFLKWWYMFNFLMKFHWIRIDSFTWLSSHPNIGKELSEARSEGKKSIYTVITGLTWYSYLRGRFTWWWLAGIVHIIHT